MKYIVEFESRYSLEDQWHSDDLTNNGKGFDKEDAEYIAQDLSKRSGIRNVKIKELC